MTKEELLDELKSKEDLPYKALGKKRLEELGKIVDGKNAAKEDWFVDHVLMQDEIEFLQKLQSEIDTQNEWKDHTLKAFEIQAKQAYRYSMNKQQFYSWNQFCWKGIQDGKKTEVEKSIYDHAISQNYPTKDLDYFMIKQELMMCANDFKKEFTKNHEEVISPTRYEKYLFPNGTLYYDQKTGDHDFKKGVFEPSDEIRNEENPMFSFEYVEDLKGIHNLLKIFYSWGINIKQLIHILAHIGFDKLDFVQRIIYLVGSGSNGKGMLMKLLEDLFPSVTNLDIASLTGDKDGTELLESSYCNISGEIKIEDLETTVLKRITGGDWVPVNPKYMKPYSILATAKLICAANTQPRLKTTTYGDIRRFLILEFNKTFPPEANFYENKMKPYLSQLFYLCLLTSKKIKTSGMYLRKEYLDRTKEIIFEESNTVYNFIKEFAITKGAKATNSKGNLGVDERGLYVNYSTWCKSTGKFPINKRDMLKQLDSILGNTHTDVQYRRNITIVKQSNYNLISVVDNMKKKH